MKRLFNHQTWAIVLVACLTAVNSLRADGLAAPKSFQDSTDLTLDQLVNIQVTSVSKKETELNQSPAAISVIMSEDIRRLGITSIPEALRLVPGLDVAQVNGNEWAISSRGFNGEYANKLLVLIDGRSVYTPVSGGVFWNAQDVVLEDLDRIEVIRGPGATLWGANAVNGVINIITKSAKETQGAMVSAAVGTLDLPTTTVRYGGQFATNVYYRVYAKYFSRDGLFDSAGNDSGIDWRSTRGGFRMDWEPSTENTLTLQGDTYRMVASKNLTQASLAPPFSQEVNVTENNDGANALARWTHTFSESSQLSLQAYYDYVKEDNGDDTELRHTVDLQLQHRFALGDRNDIVWGAGYNRAFLKDNSNFTINWNPQREQFEIYNVFLQDDVTLIADRLHLTLGSKFEHNSLTGWELEPSARLLWTPTERQTGWAAVSRATSTPSLYTREAQVNLAALPPGQAGPLPALVAVVGNPNEAAEELLAYEIGYRIEPMKQMSFDITAFYNNYKNLSSVTIGNPQVEASPAPLHLLIPYAYGNSASGDTYGAEFSAQWNVTEYWRLAGSYSLLKMQLRPDSNSGGSTVANYSAFDSPQQQFQIRSYLDLPGHLELNQALYYVDQINPPSDLSTVPVPAYFRLDMGIIWHPAKNLELGVWGQNLLSSQHIEYNSAISTVRTEIPRGVIGKITWRF
jgi:iron complex outermembrane recepter protein